MALETEIVSFLRERLDSPDALGLAAIYLYGSFAQGGTHPESDVDVAVLCREPIDSVRLFETAQDLAVRLRRDVDLIDLSKSSTVFRVQVVGKGRRIFTGDQIATDVFEMYALSDYARLQEERREVLEAYGNRYRAG